MNKKRSGARTPQTNTTPLETTSDQDMISILGDPNNGT
jgi:hypothetical protein